MLLQWFVASFSIKDEFAGPDGQTLLFSVFIFSCGMCKGKFVCFFIHAINLRIIKVNFLIYV